MDEGGDAVIGLVERVTLSGALTTIHRNGQGHNARVLDGKRGDLKGQLQRAGVATEIDLDGAGPDRVLILIHAPGRVAKTVEMLQRAGASKVSVVSRAGAEVPRPFVALAPAKTRHRPIPAPEIATD